jgi:hypothetical protein
MRVWSLYRASLLLLVTSELVQRQVQADLSTHRIYRWEVCVLVAENQSGQDLLAWAHPVPSVVALGRFVHLVEHQKTRAAKTSWRGPKFHRSIWTDNKC